jgi:glycosyltransferase involved in cell wall biosynthesis
MPLFRRRARGPLVSVVLATRDRPRLLPIALRCFGEQTYRDRELVVIDDGALHPADEGAVRAVGGRLVRTRPGTPLGEKLNLGVCEARGPLCHKMDDDDWYAPEFLATMVETLRASQREACRPTVAHLAPFLFFDLPRWELRVSPERHASGSTLLFGREDWEARPFRAVAVHEDAWFLMDQRRRGVTMLPVRAPERYLAVRHGEGAGDRGHTWTRQANGSTVEAYLAGLAAYPGAPEALLPNWVLPAYRATYRALHAERRDAAAPRPRATA